MSGSIALSSVVPITATTTGCCFSRCSSRISFSTENEFTIHITFASRLMPFMIIMIYKIFFIGNTRLGEMFAFSIIMAF